MPRIRTIKPEFWSSPGVTAMSAPARLTFIGMWNWADDSGKGTYNPRELMGFIFPNDEEMTVADFRLLCAEIRRHVAVRFYDVAGRHYYMIPSWKKHQSRHAKHTGSKLPPPEDGQEIDPANMQVIGTVDESPRDSAESRRNSAACDRESAIGTGEQGNRGTGEQISLGQTSGSTEREPSERVKPRRPKDSPEFTEFWKTYPRKTHKDAARKAFTSACRRAPLEDILAGARRFATDPNLPEKQFIPYPATWLNGGGWDDEPLPSRAPSRQLPQRKTVSEQATEVARQLGLTPEMPGQGSQIIDADIIDQKELGA
ncbi:hypothetical protein Q0N40_07475 [Corynebacterium pseudokroppenstedtii]|uniref:Uncharacterized protein n=1 Tax=Corynebacterium pseudokroppenstedtii TaxID=2804917 RepID=A0AAU0PYM6_9CORY|nr:hypothetical protein [Corynebacterium pseudokroppenstedtii]MCF8703305.1 hypothetical protein [Corynebacterium pseudokroppenstedtii]MCG2636817.1 hypothetical protein [Corynebacterium pseudokroppenstedtii]